MKLLIATLKNQSLYAYTSILVIVTLVIGGVFFLIGNTEYTSILFKYSLIIGSLPVWFTLLHNLSKKVFGVDIIAAVALIGTFVIGQYLAGIVVLLMLSGGQLLEAYAMIRARKELSLLLSKTPIFAHQKIGDTVQDIPIDTVSPGMLIIIKAGEVVSVDGTIIEGETSIDESSLTGESTPVQKRSGASIYSGTENIDSIVVVRVEKPTHETRYQSIIKLVQQAEKSKAPIVRLADKYSLYFTGVTFVIAYIAWIISHDLVRVVSVLVVATPCPLLLATPIAIISGMGKASKRGIIVKDGVALEMLSRIHTFVFDKTGTITLGTPEVAHVITFGTTSEEKILRIAASLDQLSTHTFARALLLYAHNKKVLLEYPKKCKEHFGDGIEGEVDGIVYIFGKKLFVEEFIHTQENRIEIVHQEAVRDGAIAVFLADIHSVLGAVVFQDTLREEAGDLFLKLHTEGVKKTIILTGDKKERGDAVAKLLHVTEVIGECLPDEKLKHIITLQKQGALVAMVGDGVNDAPALAQADVGIALGIQGQTASSEVADIVILSPSITRIYDVLHIAKKTITLAQQGIFFGIGASIFAMVLSAQGYIPPLVGVILQEGIDVVVIINALRLGSILALDDV